MKCHYEVLDVSQNVNNDDLKKAYRKAALRWHPDKNIDSPDLAKEQFQLVQQAYEVLTDPHERAWYDAHRDAILKGGLGDDYKDDSLDVFPYFTTSCFKGFGDDDKGFYSVYREVFNKLAAEDSEYMEDGDSDFEIPEFGNSTSDFKEVVQPFYAYWQDYTTKKSFSWLDQYDIKDLPNRRVAKLVEKENKKIRDRARKDRNEQIRNLVAFVRKRDKRVQAQAEVVKEQAAEKARLAEEKRKSKIRERQQQMKDYKESEWSKFSNFETELKNIEKTLQAEHGDHDYDYSTGDEEMASKENEDEEEAEDYDALYCPACQKLFKTVKAFANHESSKKHKENLEKLKQSMLEEEELLDGELEEEEVEDEDVEEEENEEAESDAEESEKDDEVGTSDDSEGEIIEVEGAEAKEVNGTSKEEPDAKVDIESEDSDSPQVLSKSSKKKKKQTNKFNAVTSNDSSAEENDLEDLPMLSKSKKQRRKQQQHRVPESKDKSESETETVAETANNIDADGTDTVENETDHPKIKLKGKKAKDARKQKREAEASSSTTSSNTNGVTNVGRSSKKANSIPVDPSMIDTDHACATCSSNFSSKNKLFEHLKKTGHSIYIPNKKASSDIPADEKKKGKGRRK